MSNTTLKVPPTITSITINGNVYVPNGNNEISIPSADYAVAQKQSFSNQFTGAILLTVSKPPTNPAT